MLIDELNAEQKEACLKEVGYTKEQLEADVVTIRKWLSEQHHLPPSRLKESDNFIKFYLTGCKGSLEKTKRKLDLYYTFRAHSEIFECRDPVDLEYSAFTKVVKIGTVRKPMGIRNPIRMVYGKLTDMDPDKFDIMMLARMVLSYSELRLREESLSTSNILVIDVEGCAAAHILKLKPVIIRDSLRIEQDIIPLRFSKILIFNVPSVLETTINSMFLPFVSKKIKDRIHITSGGYEEVCKHIDKNYLPNDYNGFAPSVTEISDLWHEKEMEKRDWYLNELSERCDESRRIIEQGALENPYFGVPGSLKKLVVD